MLPVPRRKKQQVLLFLRKRTGLNVMVAEPVATVLIFLMQDQQLTYIDAIKALAKHYSIEIPGESNFIELKVIRDKIEHEKKLTAEELRILDEETKLKISKQIFHLKKTDKKEAGEYLAGRSLDLEIIKPDFYYQSNPFKSEHTGIEFPVSIAFFG